jgi:uncharacterized protein (TIGR03067 family)
MSRLLIGLSCSMIAATLSIAAPALKDPKKEQDSARILGKWAVESLSVHGTVPDNTQSTSMRFSKDGTCGITNGSTENGAKYSLDTTTTPGRMKWLNGPEMTEWLCLYEFTGEKLKVAFVDPRTPAPDKIEPAKNLTIYYLTRLKE